MGVRCLEGRRDDVSYGATCATGSAEGVVWVWETERIKEKEYARPSQQL